MCGKGSLTDGLVLQGNIIPHNSRWHPASHAEKKERRKVVESQKEEFARTQAAEPTSKTPTLDAVRQQLAEKEAQLRQRAPGDSPEAREIPEVREIPKAGEQPSSSDPTHSPQAQ